MNLLGLADVDHNIGEHAGVDEQENKHWKIEPEKFVHTTIEVTAPAKIGLYCNNTFFFIFIPGSKLWPD